MGVKSPDRKLGCQKYGGEVTVRKCSVKKYSGEVTVHWFNIVRFGSGGGMFDRGGLKVALFYCTLLLANSKILKFQQKCHLRI